MKALIRGGVLAAAMAMAVAPTQAADTYPNRPVKMVVPFAAGGPADAIARMLADKMGGILKQPVIVDNRPGASGVTGMKAVAKSPADGYTFGIGSAGALAISVSLQPDPTCDPRKNLKALTLAASVPELFVVNPNVRATTLAEFIALAKAKPGSFTVASSGAGSMPHLAAELLQHYAGIRVVHVPYRGAAPAVTDLLGGQVDAHVHGHRRAPAACPGRTDAGPRDRQRWAVGDPARSAHHRRARIAQGGCGQLVRHCRAA